MKIYIVEDEKEIRKELTVLLEKYGYICESSDDFRNITAHILKAQPDLVLLDINLPFQDGYEVCRGLRKCSDVPVIVLTSRNTDLDELLSLNIGADDYISKPYNPTILLLRISAILKRTAKASANQIYRDLKINVAKGSLSSGDKEVILTKNEMIIFQLLMDRQGEIVTRDELMTALWDNEEFVNDNALTVNVSRLRTKLSDFGYEDAIETRKKQGYVLR